ncbi:MAG: hypothetical protein KDA85_17655, partial [Planctomycetaceae bacterium]|nr:hypothetical protein [Planctomycetaceae bacterium]
LAALKCRPGDYARALVEVLELKSQLQPVPVFPGVRPVEVTTHRLERIMKLRQGSRSHAPWWCWGLVLLAAVITLPGAAFVENADEPKPSAAILPHPAPPEPVASGTIRVRTAGTVDQALLEQEAEITEVFDLTQWQHLFPDGRFTIAQFESLARFAANGQTIHVSQHGDIAVLRARSRVGQQIRATLNLLSKSESSPETAAALLQSVVDVNDSTMRVILQIVEMDRNTLQRILSQCTATPDAVPQVASFDQLSDLLRTPQDPGWVVTISRAQIAMLNGHIGVISVGQSHESALVRDKNGEWKSTNAGAGIEAELTAFQRRDDRIAVFGSIQALTTSSESDIGGTEEQLRMAALQCRLDEAIEPGEIVLVRVPPADRFQQSDREILLALQVLPMPPSEVAVHQLSGTGVNSDAGIRGELVFSNPAEAQRSWQDSTDTSSCQISSELRKNGRTRTSIRNQEFELQAEADQFRLESTTTAQKIQLQGNVTIQLTQHSDASQHLMKADSVQVQVAKSANTENSMQLQAENTTVISADERSRISASKLTATLTPQGISLKSEANHQPRQSVESTRVYAVADLVVPVAESPVIMVPATGIPATIQPATPSALAPEYRSGPLINLIRATVSPDSWQNAEGSGQLTFDETTLSLVIRNTAEVHDQVSELLTQLRRIQDIQAVVEIQRLAFAEDAFERIGLDFDHVSTHT